MSRSVFALLALGVLPLFGCPTDKDEDENPEADADTDADADADADSDADTDADTVDPQAAQDADDVNVVLDYTLDIVGEGMLTGSEGDWTGMAGVVSIYESVGDTVVCDMDAEVFGTPYVGDCADCDFSFDIDSTITRDDGSADCNTRPFASYVENDTYYDLLMNHVDEVVGTYGTYTDVWYTGYGYYSTYYGADYPGPYYIAVSYEGGYFGGYYSYYDVDLTGSDLTWGTSYAGVMADLSAFYSYCSYPYGYAIYEPISGSGGSSSLDCAGEIVDSWTFEGVDGGTAFISVDTISAETAFDPRIFVSGPDTCLEAFVDDSFACTFPPPTYECAGAEVETDAGTYTVLIQSLGDCAGTEAEYQIDIRVEAG